MADRKIVKMLKSYRGINPGEIAGFEEYEADELIKQGAAVVYEPPKAEEPKKADKKADKADKAEG